MSLVNISLSLRSPRNQYKREDLWTDLIKISFRKQPVQVIEINAMLLVVFLECVGVCPQRKENAPAKMWPAVAQKGKMATEKSTTT